MMIMYSLFVSLLYFSKVHIHYFLYFSWNNVNLEAYTLCLKYFLLFNDSFIGGNYWIAALCWCCARHCKIIMNKTQYLTVENLQAIGQGIRISKHYHSSLRYGDKGREEKLKLDVRRGGRTFEGPWTATEIGEHWERRSR